MIYIKMFHNVFMIFQVECSLQILRQIEDRQVLKDLVVPCRMSPAKRAEVHPSRLGCPRLVFFFWIPERTKNPSFCRYILDICRFRRCILPIVDRGI